MYKILIVEDEDTIRENIRDILRADNFIVVEAENGRIGIEMALEEHPNLILCDVMMPEADGYEVLSEIRLNSATQLIPFIFLTAKTTREDVRAGMDLGADDYLNKPFTRQELLSAVTTRLAKQIVVENESQTKLENLRSSLTQALPREFGNQLDRILGLSKLLMEEYHELEADEALETIEQIYNSGEVLSKLTRNVLLYSELSRIGNDPKRVMLLRNLQKQCETQNIIENVAKQKALQNDRVTDLEMNLNKAEVSISWSKIKKIAEELIDNAFKFSSPNTPVQVKTTCKNNIFHLFVIDRGRGMTPEQINSLGAYMQFEMPNGEQQGFGLGLTIVKLLVELYAGNLAIESIVGQYTAVHVTLPIQSSESNTKNNLGAFDSSLMTPANLD
jgi:two-component system, sensor histidine kinase and response regulator